METTPQAMFMKKLENLQVYDLTRLLDSAFVALFILLVAVVEKIFLARITDEWWGTVEEDEWLDHLGFVYG